MKVLPNSASFSSCAELACLMYVNMSFVPCAAPLL
jgi:hypothetical protein